MFRPAIGITQPLIQWVTVDLTLGVMQQFPFTRSQISLIFTDNLEQWTYPLRVGLHSSRFWWNSSDCSLLDGEGWCWCFKETCYLHLQGWDRFNFKLVGVNSLWAKNGKSLNWALYYQWLDGCGLIYGHTPSPSSYQVSIPCLNELNDV